METPTKIRRRKLEFDRMIRLSADEIYVLYMEKEHFIYLASRYVTSRLLTNSNGFWDEHDKKIMEYYSPHVMNLYWDLLEKYWEDRNGIAN